MLRSLGWAGARPARWVDLRCTYWRAVPALGSLPAPTSRRIALARSRASANGPARGSGVRCRPSLAAVEPLERRLRPPRNSRCGRRASRLVRRRLAGRSAGESCRRPPGRGPSAAKGVSRGEQREPGRAAGATNGSTCEFSCNENTARPAGLPLLGPQGASANFGGRVVPPPAGHPLGSPPPLRLAISAKRPKRRGGSMASAKRGAD